MEGRWDDDGPDAGTFVHGGSGESAQRALRRRQSSQSSCTGTNAVAHDDIGFGWVAVTSAALPRTETSHPPSLVVNELVGNV